MSIAFLGWGSLIWDPRSIHLRSEWRQDGPVLPIEFARHSSGDRVTLVIEKSTPPVQVLWAQAADTSLQDARASLREREGTTLARIGSWPLTEPTADELVRVIGE